ncbi:protein disulfide-isomerase TMX3 isoform X2 [Cephus cinctus]|uniref:Protein disulfide-isomerase TMX3 isoform X2 n=1 Tax=Cephus cinctus TaxID=211228 RepID=A0AAJ7BK41_CEPCN|nr:protein disulfide-isomerase TMX3 isoform X2 [Cephus cinctus]
MVSLVKITFFTAFCAIFANTAASRVLELSDRFLDIHKEGQWLVMMYAPWCAHCKRLEPVWAHVAQHLHETSIRVGRVDCTRFTNVAHSFKIRGFPTILFLKGDNEFVYHGDRTRDEIVKFAQRLSGPPVQEITKSQSFDTIKRDRDVYFLYVGEKSGSLWEVYRRAADVFQPHAFFYQSHPHVVGEHAPVQKAPALFVYKENCHYNFTAVVEENQLEEVSPDMLEFRDMVEEVIKKKREKYHDDFQFGWIANPELVNSMAMMVVPLPSLIVINTTTSHHHIPEDEPGKLTPHAIEMFLEQIRNESAPKFGGNGWLVRIYRSWFEMRTTFSAMWKGNPILTMVLFGLPAGFLSLICYGICCPDILDADEEEEEYSAGSHMKKD